MARHPKPLLMPYHPLCVFHGSTANVWLVHLFVFVCFFPCLYLQPYVCFESIVYCYYTDLVTYQTALMLYRYFFPSVLIFVASFIFIAIVFNSLRKLYNHIRNEK